MITIQHVEKFRFHCDRCQSLGRWRATPADAADDAASHRCDPDWDKR